MSDKEKEMQVGVVVPAPGTQPEPPKLDMKDIERNIRAAQERTREAEEKAAGPPEPRRGTCRVCNGEVVEEFEHQCIGDPMNIPMGPASRDYYHWVSLGLVCEGCGLVYRHFGKESETKKTE